MGAGSSVVNIERTRALEDLQERWSSTLDERYVNVAMWRSEAGKRLVPPLRAFMISYGLSGNTDVTRWINGKRVYRGAPPFAFGVFPAHDNSVYWEHPEPVTTLGVYLAPGFLERAAAENDIRVNTESMPELWDCQSTALRRLGTAALGAGPAGLADEMFRDGLTHLFAVHLLAAYEPDAWPELRPSHKFAPRVRKRVVDYIEAHLATPIRLEEIAAVAGMSRYHFCRLFHAEFGVSFSRYVIGRRIDESLGPLLCTEVPIAKIAVDFGFSSQSHYTTAFRERIGATPAVVRRG